MKKIIIVLSIVCVASFATIVKLHLEVAEEKEKVVFFHQLWSEEVDAHDKALSTLPKSVFDYSD